MLDLSTIKPTKEGGAPKILFYAADKFGKSTFAAQAPKPLFIDLDKRLKEIECAKVGVESWDGLLEVIGALLKQDHDFKTLVLDSGGTAEQLAMKDVVADYNRSKSADKPTVDSVGSIPYGAGYPNLLEKWKYLLHGLQLLNDKGIIILILCHADYIDWENSDGTKFKRYVPDLKGASDKAGSLLQITRKWMDITMYGHQPRYNQSIQDGFDKKKVKMVAGALGDRVLCTQETALWLAGNTYKLPESIPFPEVGGWATFYNHIKG